MILKLAHFIGTQILYTSTQIGAFILFLFNAFRVLFSTRFVFDRLTTQIYRIGVQSLGIIILTGSFAGMVFALQSYIGFSRVGGQQFIGAVVALGLIRELGPVLSGLMVTGRASSAIAAELGTMQITEQIDALTTLGIDPMHYLIVPRIVAGTLIMPLLTLFTMIFGIAGGYIISVYALALNPNDYVQSIQNYVELSDIVGGLQKATLFGFILSCVGCYKGFNTSGGARGVGLATTQSVVTSSILILVSNYFVTKLLDHI